MNNFILNFFCFTICYPAPRDPIFYASAAFRSPTGICCRQDAFRVLLRQNDNKLWRALLGEDGWRGAQNLMLGPRLRRIKYAVKRFQAKGPPPLKEGNIAALNQWHRQLVGKLRQRFNAFHKKQINRQRKQHRF